LLAHGNPLTKSPTKSHKKPPSPYMLQPGFATPRAPPGLGSALRQAVIRGIPQA